jgi:hypothetical protein
MNKEDIEKVKAGHPVQTRTGLKARILCWDRKYPGFPVVVTYDHNGCELITAYTDELNYQLAGESPRDLILNPRKVRIDDLSGLKVGDKVYCLTFGDGIVIEIFDGDGTYPIYVQFAYAKSSYTLGGQPYAKANQTLFLSKPEIIIKEIEI